MAQIPPLLMVEPAAGQRRAAAVVARRDSPLDLESIKTELGEIRRHCRDNQTSLIAQYKKSLTQFAGVEWTVASDAAQAASYIKQVAGQTDLVSINKSSVVVNELRPKLHAAGLQTYVRYFKELDRFEKKIEDYWGLPGFHEKGLVESFDVARTFEHLRSNQVRDYIAVVGVNAVSAEDGSAFFLQHMYNISKDLEQAKKIVMVVSPEKVVRDRPAALLQTRSMGVFGLESILLDLGPKEVEKYDFEGLPIIAADRELHVLILDNGRAELFADQYRDLLLCVDCRACARQCPIGQHMDLKGMLWSPKNYLLGFLQNWIDTTEACLHCGHCHVECPLDIDLPSLIWRAQFEHYARHGRSWKKQLLDSPELLAKIGSMTVPLSNWAIGLSVTKRIMEAVVGIHRNARLPPFHRRTLKKGPHAEEGPARSRRKKAAMTEKIVYFSGCYANYYDPRIGEAFVEVLQTNGIEVLVAEQKCCGMPMMSNGNLKGAKKNFNEIVRSLARMAAEGLDILTTCPSCSFMLKKEGLSFFDSEEARFVAGRVLNAPEYLLRLYRQGRLDTRFRSVPLKVLYHNPCHLKVQGIRREPVALLELIPGIGVTRVVDNCCGMGGSYGMKAAHYDMSAKIARKLWGEIEDAEVDRVVTECGTCMLQIEARQDTKKAVHPIVLISDAYKNADRTRGCP